MEQNKFRTYLLYAVGEIALVMIGILLALQVNNWKERNTQRSQEKAYLELIRDDLILQKEENDVQMNTSLNHLQVVQPLSELIVKRFRVDEEGKAEAKRLLTSLLGGRTLGAYEATFMDLSSSGNISLISNQVLKNQIIQHYQVQRRDRDVINNNSLSTYLELWTQLIDRNLIMVAPNLDRYAVYNEEPAFNPAFDFLDDQLFDNLADENNLLLIQNILSFRVATTGIAENFLQRSNDRINRLIEAIELEIEEI